MIAKEQQQLLELLRDGVKQYDLSLTETQLSQLMMYVLELDKWNKTYNLTAIRNAEDIVKRHVFDALSVMSAIGDESPKAVADIGTGGGIPGVIIAVVFPHVQVFLVESIGKKCRFLRHITHLLGLENTRVIPQRVESWQPSEPLSVIVCRAFTALQNFVTITAHLGCSESVWLAMKSAHTLEEERALPSSFVITDNVLLSVPYEEAPRHLITLKKK